MTIVSGVREQHDVSSYATTFLRPKVFLQNAELLLHIEKGESQKMKQFAADLNPQR